MITWDYFLWWALPATILSGTGAALAMRSDKRSLPALAFSCAGILALGGFIAGLWMALQRPPMRTMGETRLWYSFFMLTAGLFTYLRWHYRWILAFSTLLATVFMTINWIRPELHDQSLMPALQSIWFVPHVTVYMFSYSVLGCAFLLAVYGLYTSRTDILHVTDSLVYTGTAFLTFGMLTGSLWAKEAWGHYWAWDPKETWAAVTWMGYLIYIHLRIFPRTRPRSLYIVLIISFFALQVCWYGTNYLPASQQSAHTYNHNN